MAAAQVEAWLEGHTTAAGSGGSCWRSQECSAPSMSRVLIPCCVVERRSGRTLTAFHRAGWPGGSGTGGVVGRSTYSWPPRLWPSSCDIRGPPSLLRPASSKAQPVPERPTWSTALSGHDGQSDTTTGLEPGLVCPASAVVTQAQTFTHSIFHS